MKAVIDTNVLLVANQQHAEASPDCVERCVERLRGIQRHGVTVVDDQFQILGEYLHKTSLNPPKGVGDVFLKWLLRHANNPAHVEQVTVTLVGPDDYAEFPDPDLQASFDAPDRKFAAVANAHADTPPIWQAVDCKWLNWWPALQAKGITVDFLCAEDASRFYAKKFPGQPVPATPRS
jgi:hypothetical protein